MGVTGFFVAVAVSVLCFAAIYLSLDFMLMRSARLVSRVSRWRKQASASHGGPVPALSDHAKQRERKAAVERAMPVFLDIVTLGLSAGLSFDASLELYCMRFDTLLASLLTDALQLWRMGVRSRAEALEELATDVQVPALTRFASTVSEALAFGAPLSQTLERQAQIIRDEQRAQGEERIERVPVKMIVPLCALIVPAMLLSILGPLLGPALSTM